MSGFVVYGIAQLQRPVTKSQPSLNPNTILGSDDLTASPTPQFQYRRSNNARRPASNVGGSVLSAPEVSTVTGGSAVILRGQQGNASRLLGGAIPGSGFRVGFSDKIVSVPRNI